jgi:hypothetical protein
MGLRLLISIKHGADGPEPIPALAWALQRIDVARSQRAGALDWGGVISANFPRQGPSDVVRLNLGDDRELDLICAALGCRRTDIFVAVSAVGDIVDDIRRYMIETLGPQTTATPAAPAVQALAKIPPPWPSSYETPTPDEINLEDLLLRG